MSLTFYTTLETTNCYKCGVMFGMPESLYNDLLKNHANFWCPNGHQQHFIGKTEAERERERRIAAEAKAARAEDRAEIAERRRRYEKGQKTRILNRVKNGVCPFCGRSFPNVEAHMKSKHDDVDTKADAQGG